MSGLWGDDFELPKTQDVIKAVKAKTENKKKERTEEQIMRARAVDIDDKLAVITKNVYRVLGSYASNTQVIYDYEEFKAFIDKAIEKGKIAIDTETNNTLDTTTCKIMGLCLYIDGEKNTYIPVNHVDPHTKEKLPNQITEEQIREQLSRLDNTFTIFHNYQFDYKVIGFTCGIWMHGDWDTSIGAKILDENEEPKLKVQYVTHIDPSIERYNINSFFENIQYELVDPSVFALYAATDAFMTYQLYKWQEKQFNLPGNERLKKLFLEIEMPVMEVAAEMELTGVELDLEYAKRLSSKYHKLLDNVDIRIEKQLEEYRNIIEQWRMTPEAQFKPTSKKPNKNGEYTLQKSKSEQLLDPPQLTSPTQFAILLYDVFKVPVVDKKSPRGTGEEILKQIDNPLCQLVLEKRGLEKLIGTYIDKLPECINPVDGRLHAHFNQCGTDTGRFSSNEPNLQNIPSKEKAIRMMFKATSGEYGVEQEDDYYILNKYDEVETLNGWKKVNDLTTDDLIENDRIKSIKDVDGLNYKVVVEGGGGV